MTNSIVEKLLEAKSPEEIIEEAKKYKVTYATFCGADVTIKFNGKSIGTVSSVFWNEDKRGIQGYFVETMFETSLLNEFFKKKANVTLHFTNEYGNKLKIELKKLRLNARDYSISMDDIVTEWVYYFTAKELVIEPNTDVS